MRKKLLKILGIFLLAALALVGGLAIFILVVAASRYTTHPVGIVACEENLQKLYPALRQYLKARGERFPENWKTDPQAWQRDLQPYVQASRLRCPKTRRPYRFNADLGGKSIKEIPRPDTVWLLCDSLPVHMDHDTGVYLFLDGRTAKRREIAGQGRPAERSLTAEAICRERLADLAQAMSLFLAINGERFPANWKQNPRAWEKALAPYSLYRGFICPETELSYRFNPELAGKSVKEISHPDTVWLLCDPLPVHGDYDTGFYVHLDGKVTEEKIGP